VEEHNKPKAKSGWVSFKKALCYGTLICFALLFAGYLWVCFSIRSSVKEISAIATQEYPGDRVEALMAYIESEDHSLRQRNCAVWVLGQIGDSRALPTLEKYCTGGPCDHSSYLCQHELKKAIRQCKGAFNATAWLPR
jgi:hypothetical protein